MKIFDNEVYPREFLISWDLPQKCSWSQSKFFDLINIIVDSLEVEWMVKDFMIKQTLIRRKIGNKSGYFWHKNKIVVSVSYFGLVTEITQNFKIFKEKVIEGISRNIKTPIVFKAVFIIDEDETLNSPFFK